MNELEVDLLKGKNIAYSNSITYTIFLDLIRPNIKRKNTVSQWHWDFESYLGTIGRENNFQHPIEWGEEFYQSDWLKQRKGENSETVR